METQLERRIKQITQAVDRRKPQTTEESGLGVDPLVLEIQANEAAWREQQRRAMASGPHFV